MIPEEIDLKRILVKFEGLANSGSDGLDLAKCHAVSALYVKLGESPSSKRLPSLLQHSMWTI
jgi:hypothetical protein